jgi:hypothetical protein
MLNIYVCVCLYIGAGLGVRLLLVQFIFICHYDLLVATSYCYYPTTIVEREDCVPRIAVVYREMPISL